LLNRRHAIAFRGAPVKVWAREAAADAAALFGWPGSERSEGPVGALGLPTYVRKGGINDLPDISACRYRPCARRTQGGSYGRDSRIVMGKERGFGGKSGSRKTLWVVFVVGAALIAVGSLYLLPQFW